MYQFGTYFRSLAKQNKNVIYNWHSLFHLLDTCWSLTGLVLWGEKNILLNHKAYIQLSKRTKPQNLFLSTKKSPITSRFTVICEKIEHTIWHPLQQMVPSPGSPMPRVSPSCVNNATHFLMLLCREKVFAVTEDAEPCQCLVSRGLAQILTVNHVKVVLFWQ